MRCRTNSDVTGNDTRELLAVGDRQQRSGRAHPAGRDRRAGRGSAGAARRARRRRTSRPSAGGDRPPAGTSPTGTQSAGDAAQRRPDRADRSLRHGPGRGRTASGRSTGRPRGARGASRLMYDAVTQRSYSAERRPARRRRGRAAGGRCSGRGRGPRCSPRLVEVHRRCARAARPVDAGGRRWREDLRRSCRRAARRRPAECQKRL